MSASDQLPNLIKSSKPNKVILVPATENSDFFRWWCAFIRPIIKLTDKEMLITASLLRQRWILSTVMSDQKMIDAILFTENIKKKILSECNINMTHLNVAFSTLRKRGVIINNTINPKIIPNIRPEDNGRFSLMIVFNDQQLCTDKKPNDV